ncbi:MAG: hypothetical protein WCQ95_10795 [Bacteroidota bacterium]
MFGAFIRDVVIIIESSTDAECKAPQRGSYSSTKSPAKTSIHFPSFILPAAAPLEFL